MYQNDQLMDDDDAYVHLVRSDSISLQRSVNVYSTVGSYSSTIRGLDAMMAYA